MSLAETKTDVDPRRLKHHDMILRQLHGIALALMQNGYDQRQAYSTLSVAMLHKLAEIAREAQVPEDMRAEMLFVFDEQMEFIP